MNKQKLILTIKKRKHLSCLRYPRSLNHQHLFCGRAPDLDKKALFLVFFHPAGKQVFPHIGMSLTRESVRSLRYKAAKSHAQTEHSFCSPPERICCSCWCMCGGGGHRDAMTPGALPEHKNTKKHCSVVAFQRHLWHLAYIVMSL